MQEYGREFIEPMVNGIQPDIRMPRDARVLVQSKNLVPSPFGQISPEKFTDPTASTVAWPFPMLARRGRRYLKMGATTLHEGSSAAFASLSSVTTYNSATPASTLAITQGGPWQSAIFHDAYFLTNGATFIFSIPNMDGSKVYCNTTITVSAVHRHKKMLALAGVSLGSWGAGTRFQSIVDIWKRTMAPGRDFSTYAMTPDTSFVFWADAAFFDLPFKPLMALMGFLGNDAFDAMLPVIKRAIEARTIGFFPVDEPGTVPSVVGLGTDLIGFAEVGIARLTPSEHGFMDIGEKPYGVFGRNCVCAGSERECIFIGAGGDLFKWVLGEGIKRLGWRHIFRLFTASQTVISYDTTMDQYWIADGTYCYVLTAEDHLGGPIEIMPTSLVREGVNLYGPKKGTATQWLLQFKEVSWGSRDFKHFQGLEIETEGATSVEAMVEWRNETGSSWVARSYKPMNKNGFCPLDMSSVDGRMNIRGNIASTDSPDVRIGGAELRFQNEGRQYARGTSGKSAGLSQ